jgi:hypothetical protein
LEFGVSSYVFSSVERGGESYDDKLVLDRLAKVRIERHIRELGTKGLPWTYVISNGLSNMTTTAEQDTSPRILHGELRGNNRFHHHRSLEIWSKAHNNSPTNCEQEYDAHVTILLTIIPQAVDDIGHVAAGVFRV